jgi:hypothetical protein
LLQQLNAITAQDLRAPIALVTRSKRHRAGRARRGNRVNLSNWLFSSR